MASGIQKAGTDLDSILAPWHPGWPQAAVTNVKSQGADANTRYAPLSTGSAPAATNIKSGGADFKTIFAALGSTSVSVKTQPSAVSGSSAAGYPSGTVTSATTTCAGQKGGGSYTYTWRLASGSASFTEPSSATTAVTATVDAASEITGTMYCTISDGVTSVNTDTVDWSLTNTTPDNIDVLSMVTGGSDNGSGYLSGAFGTLTPTVLGDGKTVIEIAGTTATAPEHLQILVIEGFSSDPGQSYLTSIAFSTTETVYDGSAATYAFDSSAGQASWQWDPGVILGLNEDVTVTITRGD